MGGGFGDIVEKLGHAVPGELVSWSYSADSARPGRIAEAAVASRQEGGYRVAYLELVPRSSSPGPGAKGLDEVLDATVIVRYARDYDEAFEAGVGYAFFRSVVGGRTLCGCDYERQRVASREALEGRIRAEEIKRLHDDLLEAEERLEGGGLSGEDRAFLEDVAEELGRRVEEEVPDEEDRRTWRLTSRMRRGARIEREGEGEGEK